MIPAEVLPVSRDDDTVMKSVQVQAVYIRKGTDGGRSSEVKPAGVAL